ncbi:hypothetical protein SYNPS1DRAFT_26810 [Syncephalis pseudoplumigaleata]|uniref:TBP-associated factor 6 n=1 Tax=Syncephalis pseudoplumigaleata TaxID=1712513 RepID=A0A4V1J270_9FUNG|nr:hypothetical protein SYNPS1DRAFT_26810 [Syncephalis pseudoplumigaleata]|eukprot:RKP27529.1 hypothetical protein SYNPS1DRAFT_26810 [Syncephalis pseudoplumigaleata]
MSIYTTDSVKQVAERLGIRQLKPDVAEALARDVQYRIHEIVQEANKFMCHARRTTLTTDDINRALRVKNVEGAPTAGTGRYRVHRQVAMRDASYWRSHTKHDATAHWLAVEGVQPAIPQNPPPSDAHKELLAKRIRLEPATVGELASPATHAPTAATEEMKAGGGGGEEKAEPVEAAAAGGKAEGGDKDKAGDAATAAAPPPSSSATGAGAAAAAAAAPQIDLKPAVKHVLSREMRMYYERVMTAIFPDDDMLVENVAVTARPTTEMDRLRLREAALTSLAEDPGLHQLLPYIIQYVLDKMTHSLQQLDVLVASLSTLNSLLSNDNLFVEPYLHQLMPGILTCMVTRRLGKSPLEPHWSLRASAAQLCARICTRYGSQYHTLQPRVARTLLRAFMDPAKPFTTHYGAIKGLAALGHQVTRHLLLPNALQYGLLLEPALVDEKNERRQEAGMCRTAMLEALLDMAKHEAEAAATEKQSAKEEEKQDGDAMEVDAADTSAAQAVSDEQIEEQAQALRQRIGDLFANGVMERVPARQAGALAQWQALMT